MGAGISRRNHRNDRPISRLRHVLHSLQHCQRRRALPRTDALAARHRREFFPRLGPPVYRHSVGLLHPAARFRQCGTVPRRHEDRRGPLHVDPDCPPLSGLLLARTAGPLLAGRIEPIGDELHPRTDRLFVRRTLRPQCTGGGPGIRGPRRAGESPRHKRQRRHKRGRPRRPILRLHENLSPHAAQSPHPERTARKLARPGDPVLQRAGLAPRPQRTINPRP